jgi:hypothetical protein
LEENTTERKAVRLRLLFVALVIANVLVLAYQIFTPDPRATAASRIEELQINPGRIKLRDSASRGPGQTAGAGKSSKGTLYRACLEWGPFTAAEVSKADSALARVTLPQPALQRPLSDVGGMKRFAFFVREPDAAIVAEIAELQQTFPGTEIKAGPCPS